MAQRAFLVARSSVRFSLEIRMNQFRIANVEPFVQAIHLKR
jgi:hypothetical protein